MRVIFFAQLGWVRFIFYRHGHQLKKDFYQFLTIFRYVDQIHSTNQGN